MPDDRDDDSLDAEAAFRMTLGIAREVSGLVDAGRLRGFTRSEIGAELKQDLPKGKHFFRYAGGMYVRARGYYRSALILLQHRLADEALALGRSLFEDSLRLDILMNLPDDRTRVDAVVRWALDGVSRDIGLLHEAKRALLGWDHALGVEAPENWVISVGRRGDDLQCPASGFIWRPWMILRTRGSPSDEVLTATRVTWHFVRPPVHGLARADILAMSLL